MTSDPSSLVWPRDEEWQREVSSARVVSFVEGVGGGVQRNIESARPGNAWMLSMSLGSSCHAALNNVLGKGSIGSDSERHVIRLYFTASWHS